MKCRFNTSQPALLTLATFAPATVPLDTKSSNPTATIYPQEKRHLLKQR